MLRRALRRLADALDCYLAWEFVEQRGAGKHVALLPPAPRDEQMGGNGKEQDRYIKALEIGKTVNMLQHLERFARAAVTGVCLFACDCMYVRTGLLSPKLGEGAGLPYYPRTACSPPDLYDFCT